MVRHAAILKNPNASKKGRLESLKFLVHPWGRPREAPAVSPLGAFRYEVANHGLVLALERLVSRPHA